MKNHPVRVWLPATEDKEYLDNLVHKKVSVLKDSVLPSAEDITLHPDCELISLRMGGTKFPATEKPRFVHIASQICSSARIHLLTRMYELQNKKNCEIIYCDTDSIVFTAQNKILNAPHQLFREGTALGEFKYEYTPKIINFFQAFAPKMYLMQIDNNWHFKVKGVV